MNRASFIKEQADMELYESYVDDGFSGSNYDRPEFKRMMCDIEAGRVNCVVVKDLSRFGRDYIETGRYLEKVFPFLGVRFIAVNDHYDSKGEIFREKELITEFKNLANDYYSRDISKKIMSAFRTKKEQGQFIGSMAPYGYILKDNHFIIDEPAAAVVRRIFFMKMQEASFVEIAKTLNQEVSPLPAGMPGNVG